MSGLGPTATKTRPLVDLEPANVTPEDLPRFPRMTSWFRPSLLSKLLLRVIVSDLFGQYADRRLIQAALDPVDAETLRERADLTKYMIADADGAIWFDYVADLGDGFDATYAIAYLLAQPNLNVDGTRRGAAAHSSWAGTKCIRRRRATNTASACASPMLSPFPVTKHQSQRRSCCFPGTTTGTTAWSHFSQCSAASGR